MFYKCVDFLDLINFIIEKSFKKRLVDIICDKMAESGENESSSSTSNNNAGASNANPNIRGHISGTTKLTDAASKLTDSQSCQC